MGDRIAGRLVLDDLPVDPQREVGVAAVDILRKPGLERGRREIFRDPVIFGLRELGAECEEGLKLLLALTPEFRFAELVEIGRAPCREMVCQTVESSVAAVS